MGDWEAMYHEQPRQFGAWIESLSIIQAEKDARAIASSTFATLCGNNKHNDALAELKKILRKAYSKSYPDSEYRQKKLLDSI